MENVIEKFYTAFKNLDAEKMVIHYHDDIVFEDPAFGVLKGEHAKNMWRMLCSSQNGKDFKINTSKINCDANKGSVHWEAHYTFSKTGRNVHNKIDAEFELKDGKIIRHVDRFDLHEWSKQALGFKGALLGWSSFFKKKLNLQTNQLLSKFEQQ